MLNSFYRLFKAARNYRNPLSIAYGRAMGSPFLRVEDRQTGLVFHCRRGADLMLAETFHARIYDIPFVPIRQGDVILDIGANHGFYSCWAARQGAIVHAFEPDPNNYRLLLQNIALNGFEGRIFAHQAAIAAETGDLQMYCTTDMGGGMSTIIPAFAVKSGMEVISQFRVSALSMNDALDRCQVTSVRICKMDCEGAEYSILSSMDATTRNRFDAMVLEYHAEAYDLRRFMELLLSWEHYHLSKAVSREPELENANLSIVKDDLIREWCGIAPAAHRPNQLVPPPQPRQQAVA